MNPLPRIFRIIITFAMLLTVVPWQSVTESRQAATPFIKYTDQAYGFSILIPVTASIESANGKPGSQTTIVVNDSNLSPDNLKFAISVFIFDKPAGVSLHDWVQPEISPPLYLDHERDLSDAGPFTYSQLYKVNLNENQREFLRAYAEIGNKVFFADLEPASSDAAINLFLEILRSWDFVEPYKLDQESVPNVYKGSHPTKSAEQAPAATELPVGYSLPTMADRYIRQGPNGTYTHNLPSTRGAIDIDVVEQTTAAGFTNIDPIFAPADGILYNFSDPCYGNVVKIIHVNGTTTYLGHLKDFRLSNGTAVQNGEMVGTGGNEGHCSNGSHVHWTARPSDSGLYSSEHLDISGIRGLAWDNSSKITGMAHGPILINDSGQVPIQDSNASLYSEDENLLPTWLQYPYEIKVGKGWSTILFKDANYQGEWGYYDERGKYVAKPLPVRSLRVYYLQCPALPSAATAEGEQPVLVPSALGQFPDCGINPPPSSNDQGAFVADVTLPDDTIVSPNQALIKTWRIRNSGTTTWGNGYQLAFVGGEPMNAPSAVNVPNTAPGNTTDISVNMTAPSNDGEKVGYWRLRNPQGTYFGPMIWVKINVKTANSGTGKITMFDVSPASPSSATQVHVVGRIQPFPEFRSMRFVLGSQVSEMTNFRQVGGQYEISVDWNTASLPRGNYALALEVATKNDLNWASPERQIKTYTLTGTPAPSNRPPDRPILQSPYNWYLKDAAGASAPVQMCVNPTSDPDGNPVQYWFELNNGAQNSGWISSTCWEPTLSPGVYSWRVKAGDGMSESGWSVDTWNFSVAEGGVTIGDITFYNVNTNNTHFCVPITYGGVQAPEVYAWINTATDGSENGEWRMLDHYGPSAPPDCTQSNYHGWWIRSPVYETGNHLVRINAIKRDSGANATRTTNYNIAYIAPPSPQLIAPATFNNNGTWFNSLTSAFQWNLALRTESQQLRVSTNPDMWNDPTPLLDVPLDAVTTAYTHTFSQDNAPLYWGIRAINSTGSTPSAGNVWFGIDRVVPMCSVQTPVTTTYETFFQVNWSGTDNSAGISTFDIQYLDSGRSEWSDWLSVPVSKTYELFIGQPGHTYAFRCRATDNANNTGDYPTTPDTAVLIDPTARPGTPWWNAAYSGKRNLAILNNMLGTDLPAGYPVHLHFDAGTSPSAADIYNASQSPTKCDDLRVVYNDTTELNRVVQSCTSSAIDIWFRSQVSIPGGTSDTTAHQLYYGNASAGSPPADPSQVWYPYRESDTAYLYFLQEGSGSTAYDASGYGRNCSINSSVQWSTSKWSNGLRFNRANGGDSRSLWCGGAAPLSSFTIEFWYKRDSDGDGRIAGELSGGGNGGGGNNWLLQDSNGRMRLDVWPCPTCGSSEVRSDFSLKDAPYAGQWNHIAITFNGGNEVRFYINGSLDSIKYLPLSGINTYSPPLEIGSVEGIGQIKANLGAFRISSGVKTSFPYGSFAAITNEPTTAVGDVIAPPITGTVDLAVLSLATYPNPGGGELVQAVVQNQGTLDTQNGIYTDLYLNHVPTGTGDLNNSLRFWINDPIAPGAIVTLTTVITDLSGISGTGNRPMRVLTAGEEMTGTLYAQTDSLGVVAEPDNQNNIFSTGTQICVASADTYENDETAATASVALVGQMQSHNFSTLADQDWIKFDAQGGVTYQLRTFNLDVAADTYLYLYDTDGSTLLASNDDANGSLASEIEWTAPVTGTYYVRVQHWNPNVEGCGTSYAFAVLTPITDLGINAVNDQVALNWSNEDRSISHYEIWRANNAPYFTPGETGSVKIADVLPQAPSGRQVYAYTDPTSGYGDPASHSYYQIVAVYSYSQTTTSSRRVGEFSIPLSPGWNLLAWPMLPNTGTLDSVLGGQLHGSTGPDTADRVLVWNPISQTYSSAWFCGGPICESWGEPWANHWLANDYSLSPLTLQPDTGFWIQNRSGVTETVVLVGRVAEVERSVSIGTNWQMLGSAFPVSKTLDNSNLPAIGSTGPDTADRVLMWDAPTQRYRSAWFCGGPVCESWGEPWANHWLANDYSPTDIVLQPGQGLWFLNRHSSTTWNNAP